MKNSSNSSDELIQLIRISAKWAKYKINQSEIWMRGGMIEVFRFYQQTHQQSLTNSKYLRQVFSGIRRICLPVATAGWCHVTETGRSTELCMPAPWRESASERNVLASFRLFSSRSSLKFADSVIDEQTPTSRRVTHRPLYKNARLHCHYHPQQPKCKQNKFLNNARLLSTTTANELSWIS